MDPLTGLDKLGCPSSQEWCRYTPRMTIAQFICGYAFTTIGYPLGVTLIQTIFSKVLGPRPQGLWMGLMTGAGCLSRVLGPIFVGVIYTRLGIYQTFGITGLTLVVSMVWLSIVDKRLVPPGVPLADAGQPLQPDGRDDSDKRPDVELPLVPMPARPATPIERQQQQQEIAMVLDKE